MYTYIYMTDSTGNVTSSEIHQIRKLEFLGTNLNCAPYLCVDPPIF